MGFPLGPLLANAFLCHHETKWLNDYPEKFKLVFYKRYVDNVFVFNMNSKHKDINFSFETEKDGQMLFLGVNMFRENGKLWTMFTEKKHLLELIPTFRVSYQ